jgi:hypothetical protein
MKERSVSLSAVGQSDWICVDRRGSAGIQTLVILDFESGQGCATFEFTTQDPDNCGDLGPTIIIEHDVLNVIEESCASTVPVPFQAFRLNVLRYDSGTISARIVQSGDHDN